MIRLFDSVYLHFEWGMNPQHPAMLFSENFGNAVFIESMLYRQKMLSFVHKQNTFRQFLGDRFENSPNAFWQHIIQVAQGQRFFIYADERSYNDILLSYLRSIYPNQSCAEIFCHYNLIMDRLRYADPLITSPEFQRTESDFPAHFEATIFEPLAHEFISHLCAEILIAHYLATNLDDSILEILKPSILKHADEFLWSHVIADYRRLVLTGIFDLETVDPDLMPDIEMPSLEKYFSSHPEMALFSLGRDSAEAINVYDNFPIREILNHKLVAALPLSLSPLRKKMVEACLTRDPKVILEVDLDAPWGTPLLSDSNHSPENQYLFVGYLYRCWRNQRKDLLSRFKLDLESGNKVSRPTKIQEDPQLSQISELSVVRLIRRGDTLGLSVERKPK